MIIDKQTTCRVASPVIGFVVVFVALYWLFGKITELRKPDVIDIQIEQLTKEPEKEKKKANPPYTPEPVEKKEIRTGPKKKGPPEPPKSKVQPKKVARKEASTPPKRPTKAAEKKDAAKKQPAPRPGFSGVGSDDRIPAITVYYRDIELDDYMTALAERGCVFLIKSPLGRVFASFNTTTGKSTTKIPENLYQYSPRGRVLAIYGENNKADRIIEEAVRRSPWMSFPDECRLVAMLSHMWESTLLSVVINAAVSRGIAAERVESGTATFESSRFVLEAIRVEGGMIIPISQEIT